MKRVLLDENLPRLLKRELAGYEVRTVVEAGWAGIKNGKLLRLAEAEFDVFVTADKNLPHQQPLPMKLPHRTFALLCLLLTTFGTTAFGAPSDEAAVLQTIRDACKTYLDGDAGRIAELLTEDFTLTDADGVVTTRADDIEHARKGTIRYEVFENHDMKVRLYGDAAVITGITKVKGTAGNTPFAAELQFTDTLVRRDGRWLVAASHVSRVSS